MEDSKKTQLVRAKPAYDGRMVEFRDAVTDTFVGSCGIHWWEKNAVEVKNNLKFPPWPIIRP